MGEESKDNHRKYRTELPNMIDDSDLSVYEFRLYAHYKRVAGDSGECTEGLRTIAEKCRMSIGKASMARKELIEKKYIILHEGNSNKGEADTVLIVNMWKHNYKKYAPPTRSPHEQVGEKNAQKPVHQMNTPRSPHEQTCSPHEHKKEQYKKELIKKEQTTTSSFADAQEAADKKSQPSKSDLTEEQRQEFSILMKHHADRIGAIPDGGKQGKAIKWLLTHGYTAKQAIGCYQELLLDEWRDIIDWQTVQKNIGQRQDKKRRLNSNGSDKKQHSENSTAAAAGYKFKPADEI